MFELPQQRHGIDISVKEMVPFVVAVAFREGLGVVSMLVFIQTTWQ